MRELLPRGAGPGVMLEFLSSLTVALIGSRRLRDLVLALGDLLGFVHCGEPRRGTASARAPGAGRGQRFSKWAFASVE